MSDIPCPRAVLEIQGKKVVFDVGFPDTSYTDCLRCDDPLVLAETRAIARSCYSAHPYAAYQATLFLMKLAHKTGGSILEMHDCAPIPENIEDYGVPPGWLDM